MVTCSSQCSEPCKCTSRSSCPCKKCATESNSSCPAEDTTNDSVVLHTGQFIFEQSLLGLDAIGGLGWNFGITYLSNSGVNGMLGANWNYPQQAHLEQVGSTDVALVTSDNTREVFLSNGDGTYSSELNNSMARLYLEGTGASEEFVLIGSSGTVTRFFGFDALITTPGQAKSVTDRHGNARTYEWQVVDSVVQLAKEVDAYGRAVQYRYYDSSTGNLLQEIEDSLGRKLNFQYDASQRLVAVITPSILHAAEGNTFPGGTAYVFEYDTTNTDPAREDDLIRIYFPNEATAYINVLTRTVDVAAVYASSAQPRYFIEYGQNSLLDSYGRVIKETVGDPASNVGGTYEFSFEEGLNIQSIFYDAQNPSSQDIIVKRTTMLDRNGNETVMSFNDQGMTLKSEVKANRTKSSLQGSSWITYTRYNESNQPTLVIHPEGNSTEYVYDDGMVDFGSGAELYAKRKGLLLAQIEKPGNAYSITSRSGSNNQTQLVSRYFYDPIFNAQIATIDPSGNPIDAPSTYFTPQNGGTTPTDSDRSRYATIQYLDYQQNTLATIKGDSALQALLFPEDDATTAASKIQKLIEHVDAQMKATDGTGGLPAGFPVDLGDLNGDATGDGNTSGLPASRMAGNVVKTQSPSVRQLVPNPNYPTSGDPWMWQDQTRQQIATFNDRGQVTTQTDAEGNLTVYVRYPENDPEGDGRFVSTTLSTKQYGRLRETHTDADPDQVMDLVGQDGDLTDFISGKITRTNTPGVYQDLTTRHEGTSGCSTCSYDALGNVLTMTDPRGFTVHNDRNELGAIYRVTQPKPYEYQTETHYDAEGRAVRVDTQDQQVAFVSTDPSDADYARFIPTGSGSTAHCPTTPGAGGTIRPGWFSNFYQYDVLGRRIQEDIDATGSSPSSLTTTYTYDANGNLIQITYPLGNTVQYDYDERNLRIAQLVGGSVTEEQSVVVVDGALTVYSYDGNGNLVSTISPSDRDPLDSCSLTCTITDAFGTGLSVVHTGDWLQENTYDGFDRLITSKDALGNVSEQTYDPRGQAVESKVSGPARGASPANRTGTDNTLLARTQMRFDEAGRTYEQQQDVFLVTASPSGVAAHTLPSTRTVTHVGGGLEANATTNGHTATATLTSGQTSYVLTRTVYDRLGRATAMAADNTGITYVTYDGVGRQLTQTDALGNVTENEYDAAGNVIRSTRTEKCTITSPTVDDEVFVTLMRYDALNRLVMQVQQGNDGDIAATLEECCTWPVQGSWLVTLIGYDSRGNTTVQVDPKGNTTLMLYDGAGRNVEVHQHLREDGQGQNPPAENQTFLAAGRALIRQQNVYDANSRLAQLVDDRGGVTNYRYDDLNRQTAMEFNDGSARTIVYNDASDAISRTDENGSTFAYVYDAMGRRVSCGITPATGVMGTSSQSFQYDGLSRLTRSVDSVSTSDAAVDTYADSLGRAIEEKQSYDSLDRYVTQHAFTSYPATGQTLPQGRTLTLSHDMLYRKDQVQDSAGSIAAWEFFGPGRIAEMTLGNGLICSMMNNARTHSAVQLDGEQLPAWGDDSSDRLGYDGTGRLIAKRFLAGGINGTTNAYNNAQSVVGFTTSYDKSGNKRFERHLHAQSRSHLYQPAPDEQGQYPAEGSGIDSANRLRQYQRGTLATDGGSVATAITLSNTDHYRSYDLDGLGNWKRTSFATSAAPTTVTSQQRQHNYLNQITRTKDEGQSAVAFGYDGATGASNGNLADDGQRLMSYDALNRLVQVKRKSDSLTIAAYVYDALNRRIRKTVSNDGLSGSAPNGQTDFLWRGWQCVEERDNLNSATKQYVWGQYIDELIQQKTYVVTGPQSLAASAYYALQDLHYRTTALTDSTGAIVEAYDTDAYGNTLLFTAAGTASNWWADDATQSAYSSNEHIFQGLRLDVETGLIYNRARMLNSELGRFIQRDPLDYVDGMGLYEYLAGRPLENADPDGRSKRSCCSKGTCDTWYLTIIMVTSVGGGAAFVGVHAELRADHEVCDISDYPEGMAQDKYGFIGAGIGAGVKFSISFGAVERIFKTECVKWEDHEGGGRVSVVGMGVVWTYSHLIVTTPQTQQHVGGWSYGIDATMGVLVGDWRFSHLGDPAREGPKGWH